MTDFPANIRTFDAATFEEEVEDVAIDPGEMDGGYLITRPRFTRAPRRTFRFRYTDMDDDSKALLQDFWSNVAKGRSVAFDWRHPATKRVVNVRFGQMTMKFRRIGYGHINRWETDTIVLTEV